MSDEKTTESFDEMLRQTLESAQMPVPPGVWESVAGSVGAGAAAATKTVLLKWTIGKFIAGFLVSGVLIYGTYRYLSDDKTLPSSVTQTENLPTDQETVYPQSTDVQTGNNTISGNTAEDLEDVQQQPGNTGDHTERTPVATADSNHREPLSDPHVKHESNTGSEPVKNPAVEQTPAGQAPNKPEVSDKSAGSEAKRPVFTADSVIIPDVFTPYEIDGYNDCYRIPMDNEAYFLLQIFDLNGNKVFETTNKADCWDGRNRNTGTMCPRGSYIYKLRFELKTGYKRNVRGELSLL